MKTRLILIILLTLIMGFVLGMLTSAQLRLHKLRPMRVYFSDNRMREGFYRIIQPDEKQKAEIDLILDKYAKINSETQARFRKELDANVKALRKELDARLTKEQIARLREMDKRREEMMRQERMNRKNDSGDFRDQERSDHYRRRLPSGDRPPSAPYQRGKDSSDVNL